MTIKRFPPNKRFRVIIGQACFYSTAKTIRNGIGDFTQTNAAVQKALDSMEYCSIGTTKGIAGIWEGLRVQLDVA
jgi:hypothetical protein